MSLGYVEQPQVASSTYRQHRRPFHSIGSTIKSLLLVPKKGTASSTHRQDQHYRAALSNKTQRAADYEIKGEFGQTKQRLQSLAASKNNTPVPPAATKTDTPSSSVSSSTATTPVLRNRTLSDGQQYNPIRKPFAVHPNSSSEWETVRYDGAGGGGSSKKSKQRGRSKTTTTTSGFGVDGGRSKSSSGGKNNNDGSAAHLTAAAIAGAPYYSSSISENRTGMISKHSNAHPNHSHPGASIYHSSKPSPLSTFALSPSPSTAPLSPKHVNVLPRYKPKRSMSTQIPVRQRSLAYANYFQGALMKSPQSSNNTISQPKPNEKNFDGVDNRDHLQSHNQHLSHESSNPSSTTLDESSSIVKDISTPAAAAATDNSSISKSYKTVNPNPNQTNESSITPRFKNNQAHSLYDYNPGCEGADDGNETDDTDKSLEFPTQRQASGSKYSQRGGLGNLNTDGDEKDGSEQPKTQDPNPNPSYIFSEVEWYSESPLLAIRSPPMFINQSNHQQYIMVTQSQEPKPNVKPSKQLNNTCLEIYDDDDEGDADMYCHDYGFDYVPDEVREHLRNVISRESGSIRSNITTSTNTKAQSLSPRSPSLSLEKIMPLDVSFIDSPMQPSKSLLTDQVVPNTMATSTTEDQKSSNHNNQPDNAPPNSIERNTNWTPSHGASPRDINTPTSSSSFNNDSPLLHNPESLPSSVNSNTNKSVEEFERFVKDDYHHRYNVGVDSDNDDGDSDSIEAYYNSSNNNGRHYNIDKYGSYSGHQQQRRPSIDYSLRSPISYISSPKSSTPPSLPQSPPPPPLPLTLSYPSLPRSSGSTLDSITSTLDTRKARSASNPNILKSPTFSSNSKESSPIATTGHDNKSRRPRRKKEFRFDEMVLVYETWGAQDYDRQGTPNIQLTPELALDIKRELNDYKLNEMPIHPESHIFTHIIY